MNHYIDCNKLKYMSWPMVVAQHTLQCFYILIAWKTIQACSSQKGDLRFKNLKLSLPFVQFTSNGYMSWPAPLAVVISNVIQVTIPSDLYILECSMRFSSTDGYVALSPMTKVALCMICFKPQHDHDK